MHDNVILNAYLPYCFEVEFVHDIKNEIVPLLSHGKECYATRGLVI